MSCGAREPRWSFRRSFLSLYDFVQALEAVVPGAAVNLQPAADVFESPWAEVAVPRPAVLLGRYQSSLLQDAHVFLETGQRHPGRRGQFADRGRATTKPLENTSPCWVGQGRECAIQFSILNH